MGSFIELLLVALMPVLKVLFVIGLGAFLAIDRVDILGETARRYLNRIVFYVFGPAMVFSNLAQTITIESFITMWFMPVNILLTFVIGSALGWLLSKVTRAPTHIKGLVVSACSAGNLGALPIIIIPAICKQKGSPFGAVAVCNKYGLAYASLSMAIGVIYIWLYIYNIVRISSKKEVDNRVADIPETPRVSSSGFSDVSPVNQLTHSSSEGHERKTSLELAERRPPLMHQSVAAPVEKLSNSNNFVQSIAIKIKAGLRNINLKAILAPSTIAAAAGFLIGMIAPFRKLLFGDDAHLHVVGDTALMIGEAAVPAMTLILGANLLKGLKGSGVKLKIILGIIVVRYIFLPSLGILIVKGAVRAGFVNSDDLLLQFVILLQYALPPALSIGTITQLFGESASACAVIMLWTYAVAPVTFTLWLTLFLWLVSQ